MNSPCPSWAGKPMGHERRGGIADRFNGPRLGGVDRHALRPRRKGWPPNWKGDISAGKSIRSVPGSNAARGLGHLAAGRDSKPDCSFGFLWHRERRFGKRGGENEKTQTCQIRLLAVGWDTFSRCYQLYPRPPKKARVVDFLA